MKRVAIPLLLVLALVAIAATGYWFKRPNDAQAVPCTDPLAGCSFIHRGASVTVNFSAPPSPLDAFELRVNAPDVEKISAEFQMNGMDMGFNRYDLRPAGKHAFTAKVTLPLCVSGRHDWTVYLEVDGTRYALPFSTE